MNINTIQGEEKTTFTLSGRLDTISSPKLQEMLLSEFGNTEHIEIDFNKLDYVTSAGLRVLLLGEKTAKARGCKQTIVNVSDDIMEVFDITGFSGILNIV